MEMLCAGLVACDEEGCVLTFAGSWCSKASGAALLFYFLFSFCILTLLVPETV
jgi:hypothetical protein